MAGAEGATRATGIAPFRFDPAWLLDAVGAAGAGALAWALTGAPGAPEFAAVAREAAPLAVAAWIGGRLTVAAVSGRLKRGAARADLYRRLVALDAALAELRRTVSRDTAVAFLDRADAYVSGLTQAKARLSGKERAAARACAEAAVSIAVTVRESLGDRHGVEALAHRIRRDVARAERFGDVEAGDAHGLIDAVDDAMELLDESLYAERNADHFGRLEADRRAFVRRLEWLSGGAATRVEERGAELFEALRAQLAVKVAVAETAVRWREDARFLEARLASTTAPSLTAPAPASVPRLPRFDVAAARAPERPSAQIIRLPAAND